MGSDKLTRSIALAKLFILRSSVPAGAFSCMARSQPLPVPAWMAACPRILGRARSLMVAPSSLAGLAQRQAMPRRGPFRPRARPGYRLTRDGLFSSEQLQPDQPSGDVASNGDAPGAAGTPLAGFRDAKC